MALHLRRLTNILMAGERTRRARHCCTGYDHIAVHCYYSVRRTPSCAFFSSLISELMASYRHHRHQRHHHQVIQAAREETRNCVVVFAGRAQWTTGGVYFPSGEVCRVTRHPPTHHHQLSAICLWSHWEGRYIVFTLWSSCFCCFRRGVD